eukprot:6101668-Pyramimonas_sp.AAC.1
MDQSDACSTLPEKPCENARLTRSPGEPQPLHWEGRGLPSAGLELRDLHSASIFSRWTNQTQEAR